MTGRDYLRIWYRVQIGAILLILAMMMVRNFELGRHHVTGYLLVAVIILALGLTIELLPDLPVVVKRLNSWLQGLTQPLIQILAWDVITREIITLLRLPSRGVISLMILYYLVMFAPFASVVGGQLKNGIERFIFAIVTFEVVFNPLIAFPDDLIDNHFLYLLLATGVIGAIAYFILITTVMRAWKLSWPGLKPHWSGDFNWLILAGLVAFDLAFTYLNVGGFVDLSKSTWRYFLTATEAAIAEETLFRFALLGILFYAWRNWRQRLPLALATSSILFGLLHLVNVTEQSWDLTVVQVIGAGGLGLFFAVVYVYTGQLWLALLMHAFLDWTSFIATGSTAMTGKVTPEQWIGILVELAIFVLIAVWMMFGKRRQVMNRHVARLTGAKQHFDFQINY